jgi:predicted  nucleic acid-binding Zn-ribbon protein
MTKEIEGEEAKVRAIEDEILEKMLEAEEIQKQVQEAGTRLESQRSLVAAEIARLESEQKVDDQERRVLQARRSEIQSSLSEPTRSLYDRIRPAKRGIAVAEVREGLCTACNVLLRPQVYNEVRTNEILLTCDNCGRIIYYPGPAPLGTNESDSSEAGATV